ncbi:MAG: class I SAM-dependent methyltransferase [Chitinophagaceae bacterium]|nr:class I SAM-dependent methyltransferase [Chitinophagaceae bacterium]
MNDLVHYSHCPVCSSADIKDVLTVKDHSVSGQSFRIAECADCSLRFTQDVPDAVSISPYYKAEEYISHTNTSKGLINRVYKFVRNRTMIRKRRLVQSSTGLQKGNILDLGSGVGSFVNEMKQHGWTVTGLEPDADARKVANDLYQLDLGDTNEFYQLRSASFDAITMWHVLEHVHDLSAYIQQLRNILKDNGRLLVAVPNYTSFDAKSYGEYWAAYDVPRHLYHFSPRSVQVLMEKHGLRVSEYKPMWYDSFYISLLSSRYKHSKTNWLIALVIGIRSNLKALRDVKKCSSVIYIISR